MMTDHIFGITDCFICISSADMFMCTDIIFFFIKYLRCILCRCFLNCTNMRQHFIFYFDQFLSFLSCFSVFCSNNGNGISEIMCQTPYRYQ